MSITRLINRVGFILDHYVRVLLEGLTEIVERHWLVMERHHEEQIAILTRIGNELQFLCEEIEDINGTDAQHDYMKVETRGISVPVETNPSRE